MPMSPEQRRELRDLCRTLLGDGVVDLNEARRLRSWLARNSDVHVSATGQRLWEVIGRVLRDSELSIDERIELEEIVEELAESDR